MGKCILGYPLKNSSQYILYCTLQKDKNAGFWQFFSVKMLLTKYILRSTIFIWPQYKKEGMMKAHFGEIHQIPWYSFLKIEESRQELKNIIVDFMFNIWSFLQNQNPVFNGLWR